MTVLRNQYVLGDLVDFVGGGTPSRDNPDFWGGSIPWASVKDLSSSELKSTLESISEAGLKRSATNLIAENSVIMATRVGLGKVAINRVPLAINQDLKALRLKRKDVLPEYLYYFILHRGDSIARAGVGATVKGVTIQFLQKIPILLPSIAEQQRIVEVLQQSERLRELRNQADRRTADLIPAIFHHTFGDPSMNPRGWRKSPVSQLCTVVRGSSPRPRSDPRFYGGPIPRLMVEDLTRDGWSVTPRIDTLTLEGARYSRPVTKGSVVMAVSGNIGLVGCLAVDACIHDGFVALSELDQSRLNPIFATFCLMFLRSTLSKHSAGAIFQNITTNDVKGLEIILPPLKAQEEFLARLAIVREMETKQDQSRRRMNELFQSMLHRAFEGEL